MSWRCQLKFPGCIKCDSQLTKCYKCSSNGYFLKNSRCKKCSSVTANCAKCWSSGKCKACNLGYVLSGSRCVKCSWPKVVYRGKCVPCRAAFGPACTSCTSSGCTRCTSGWFLNDFGECKACSSQGCMDCPNDYCRRCDEDNGYFLSNGVCKYCLPPRVVYFGKCVPCSVPFGSACIDCIRSPHEMACTECKDGWALNADGKCVKEDCNIAGCLVCNHGICTLCDESNGWHLEHHGLCVPDICNIKGCLKCQGLHCVQCDELNEYYLSGGICLPCHFPKVIRDNKCLTCTAAFGTGCTSCTKKECTKCDDGWTLNSGRCVAQCQIPGCEECFSGVCFKCKPGLDLVAGHCKQTLTFEDIDLSGPGTGNMLPISGYYSMQWDDIGAVDTLSHTYAKHAVTSGKQVRTCVDMSKQHTYTQVTCLGISFA